uniref:Uncharacterized protein n=1 Tax=Knipowitschia caucasica TaxID=637954 RepID=A0AAV2JIS5_KNICA
MSPLRRPVGHKLSVGLPESQQDSTPTSIDFHDQQWERRTGLLHHQALDLELFGSVVNLGRRDTQHLVRSINARLSLGCAPFGHAPPAASQSASGQADEGLPYTLQPRLRAHSVIGAEVPCGCTGDPWWWCLSRTV